MKKIISDFFNGLWMGFGILTELTPHWIEKVKNISPTATAVYGFYVFLITTPFIGTLLIVSYIYDEMMGYIKIHRNLNDPFFAELKPGIENNILTFVALLVANVFFISIILLWF